MNNHFAQTKAIKLTHWSVVKITGNEVVTFLQGQLTCDVTQINEHQGSLAALCNNQGRVLAVFYLFQKENDFYALLPSSIADSFIKHLTKFAVFSKVTLEDVSNDMSILAFLGDQVEVQLESLCVNLPAAPYQTITDGDFTICNLPGTTATYLIWGSNKSLQFSDTLTFDTDDTYWRLDCIMSGWPFLNADTVGLSTPHMLNLPQLEAVSLNKGCYVGQEIISRTHYLGKAKRHLYLLIFNEQFEAKPGEVILADDQEAGILLDCISLPQQSVALAVLQESAITQTLYCRDAQVTDLIKTTDLGKVLA